MPQAERIVDRLVIVGLYDLLQELCRALDWQHSLVLAKGMRDSLNCTYMATAVATAVTTSPSPGQERQRSKKQRRKRSRWFSAHRASLRPLTARNTEVGVERGRPSAPYRVPWHRP